MSKKFSKGKFVFAFFLLLIFSYFYLARLPKPVKAVSYTRKVFLQKANTISFDFRWVTDTKEQLIVKYGLTTSYGSQVTSDTEQLVNCGNNASFPCTGGNNNHAKITGLAPNTKYYYQVTTASGTPLTPAGDQNHYFETPPAAGSTTPFTWAIFGDSGNNSSAQNNVAKQVFAKKPDLVIIAGDIAYPYSTDFNNNNIKYFDRYSDATPGQNTMSFSPFYVTCGNHETSCPTVMADHSLPGGGKMSSQLSTYSYNYGNVHFVALNSNASYAYNAANPSASDPQMAWAYNDLKASNQPWKVVYWHHNGWSAGSHSTNTAIVDNFVRMASDVGADLAIYGHSHVYERWNRKTGFYPNIQVYTIGNGGQSGASSCTTASPGPGCAAKSSSGDSAAGFLFFEVSGDTMTARYITQSGANPDTITLNSGGGATPLPTPTSGPTPTPTKTPSPTPTKPPTPTPTKLPTPTVTPTKAPTPTPTPAIGCIQASTTWQNTAFTSQTGTFTAEFDATPVGSGIDVVFGLSSGAASAYTNLAAIARFNSSGFIDARNGAAYQAATSIPYSGGTSYHFRLVVNFPNRTYSIYVRPSGGVEQTVGLNYAFRSDWTGGTSLNNLGVRAGVGSATACNLSISGGTPTPTTKPTVTATPTPPPLPGDINKDGVVNILDFQILSNNFGSSDPASDLNKDGIVNILDFQILSNNFGRTSGTPTPTTSIAPTATRTPTPTPGGPTPTIPVPISGGIWISQAEIARLPITGQAGCAAGSFCARAWDGILSRAQGSWGTPNLSDYAGLGHSQDIWAGAVAAVRLSFEPNRQADATALRQKVLQGLQAVMGTEAPALPTSNGGKDDGSLAISRQFLRYVIAADLLGVYPWGAGYKGAPDYVDYMFRTKFTFRVGDGGTAFAERPLPGCASNGCAMGAATYTAIAAYMKNTTLLDGAWRQFQRYTGNNSIGNPIEFSSAGGNWYHNNSAKSAINPKGATCAGSSYPADGVIPNDQGRGGSCPSDPNQAPGYTQYPWEGLQGIYAQALMLYRLGYKDSAGRNPFQVNDSALLRAVQYQWYLQSKFGGSWYDTGRAAWVKHLVYKFYGYKPVQYDPIDGGRNMGFTQWTHQ